MGHRGRAAVELCGGAWSIASEAARRRDGDKLVKVEIDDRLQGLAGGAVAQRLGQSLEPSRILSLQGDKLGDSGTPPPRSA